MEILSYASGIRTTCIQMTFIPDENETQATIQTLEICLTILTLKKFNTFVIHGVFRFSHGSLFPTFIVTETRLYAILVIMTFQLRQT